jgi:hypothetical protein
MVKQEKPLHCQVIHEAMIGEERVARSLSFYMFNCLPCLFKTRNILSQSRVISSAVGKHAKRRAALGEEGSNFIGPANI